MYHNNTSDQSNPPLKAFWKKRPKIKIPDFIFQKKMRAVVVVAVGVCLLAVLGVDGARPTGPCSGREATVEGCIGTQDLDKAKEDAQLCYYSDLDAKEDEVCVLDSSSGTDKCIPMDKRESKGWLMTCFEDNGGTEKLCRTYCDCDVGGNVCGYRSADYRQAGRDVSCWCAGGAQVVASSLSILAALVALM